MRKALPIAVAVAIVAAIVYALWPKPIPVDFDTVVRGPMEVTVDEEGKTRIKERYVVSAPLAGRLRRIELKAGDRVEAGKTLLAVIEPSDPALLDVRSQAEAVARVKGAEAAVARGTMQREQAERDADGAHHQRDQSGDQRCIEEAAAVLPILALEQPAQGADRADGVVDGVHA